MSGTDSLKSMKCVPCEGGEKPLTPAEVESYLPRVPGWTVTEGPRLTRRFRFRAFKDAMEFVNRMADVAEEQGHHPDFFVSWNEVRVELWTHATGGLHQNDFILAAKIAALVD